MKPSFLVVLPLAILAAGCAFDAPPVADAATLTSAHAEVKASGLYQANFLEQAKENDAYRRVLYTGPKSQLALMAIPANGDIGLESHAHVEVMVFVVSGKGTAMIQGALSEVHPGDVIVTAPNVSHNVINTGPEVLRLMIVASPPNHIARRVQLTKEAAEADVPDYEFSKSLEWSK